MTWKEQIGTRLVNRQIAELVEDKQRGFGVFFEFRFEPDRDSVPAVTQNLRFERIEFASVQPGFARAEVGRGQPVGDRAAIEGDGLGDLRGGETLLFMQSLCMWAPHLT